MMYTSNYLFSSIILLAGSGFYLYKLVKIESEKSTEKTKNCISILIIWRSH